MWAMHGHEKLLSSVPPQGFDDQAFTAGNASSDHGIMIGDLAALLAKLRGSSPHGWCTRRNAG